MPYVRGLPDKYIALIQPRDVVDDRLPAPELIPAKAPAAR